MRKSLGACAGLLLVSGAALAQSRVPDLSGRWRLVEPTPTERTADTLAVIAVDALLITHTPRGITIEHPSKPGSHPEAGEFKYGVGGFIGGPDNHTAVSSQWGVTHIGTQLMMSRSTLSPPDARGVRATVARGSMWRLEAPDRLVIEFGEEQTGERPKTAMRVYRKVAPN